MHIPEGFLTGEAAALGTLTAVVGVGVCLRGASRTAREKDLILGDNCRAFYGIQSCP